MRCHAEKRRPDRRANAGRAEFPDAPAVTSSAGIHSHHTITRRSNDDRCE